ncbi:MAG: nucleotide pyrophosphohydrolase [Rikenellaceae bacterium]
MKISEYQSLVDSWITNEGVRYFEPLTNMVVLTEEVGELARVVARKYGEQSAKEGEENLSMADEIADVFWVLTALSNQCGINLESALVDNYQKKNTRDIMRHKLNEKLKK